MKKLVPLVIALLSFSLGANAQKGVYDGLPLDSSEYNFANLTTLDNSGVHGGKIDTMGCKLWRIGPTNKTFGSTSGTLNLVSMITDTLNPYPLKANDFFVLKKIENQWLVNVIVDITHKYQTRAGKDGGVVEFSMNQGTSWENVKGSCNIDSGFVGQGGVLTENYYATTDTIATGEAAFTGSSNGWKTSRVQFFLGLPIKSTGGATGCSLSDIDIWLRFRFVSDSTADTLDGWQIANIKVEHDKFTGDVATTTQVSALQIYPNPSKGTIHFPPLTDEQDYTLDIITPIGTKVFSAKYKHTVDLQQYPRGVYYYNVSNGKQTYTGKILLE